MKDGVRIRLYVLQSSPVATNNPGQSPNALGTKSKGPCNNDEKNLIALFISKQKSNSPTYYGNSHYTTW